MKKINMLLITLIMILLASCNLDSNQGVLQMAYNATHKTGYTITDVYGTYDNGTKVLMNRDHDLWYATTEGNELRQVKVKDLTRSMVTPIFINESGTLFYAYREDSRSEFRFGSASIEEISSESFSFIDNLNEEGAELQGITKFYSTNLNLDECLIVYGTDKETNYCKITDKRTASSLSLSGEVGLTNLKDHAGNAIDTRAATIFGTDALFVYYEDSDLENTPDKLAVIRVDGTSPEAVTLGVDEDNIPMGYDGGYFITFDGDLYQFNDQSNNGYDRIGGFVSDLRYRINHRLVLSNDDQDRNVGFMYRNGVYVREVNDNNVRPRILSIDNNDNDIISTSYIGHTETTKGEETYDRYLYATQNNSFIILEVGPGTLNSSGSNPRYEYQVDDSMLQQYNPHVHGDISQYTASSN